MMKLNDYLARVGFVGAPKPDLDTLRALHRAHLFAIAYDSLDVYLGRGAPLDLANAYDKIVNHGRGGWCYQMNGVFAWALGEIGFDVDLLSSDVGRARGPKFSDDGDHLVLRVNLDEPYLADVGFGNGFVEPLPLREGEWRQGARTFRLERDGERWWMTIVGGAANHYDFTLRARDYADFAPRCRELQTLPDSGFVRLPKCYRFADYDLNSLRGLTFEHASRGTASSRVLDSRDDMARTLRDVFGLQLSDDFVAELWGKAEPAHRAWAASA